MTAGTWRMWAGDTPTEYRHIGDHRYVKAYGHEPVQVDVTETPDGDYYGWIPTGRDEPEMIWRGWARFTMCFPHGSRVEQDAGKGRIVRLTITPAGKTP